MSDFTVILGRHLMWLYGGKEGERACLEGADLRNIDLSGANLMYANLRGARLDQAHLERTLLAYADLEGAHLVGAFLQNNDLRGACFVGATLEGAHMRRSYLRGANLEGAKLGGADLREACLRGASIKDAYCECADFYNADLHEANLDGVKGIYLPIACPEEGDFIGYKAAGRYIVKLAITSESKRCSGTGRMCRCSEAIVLSIETVNGKGTAPLKVRSDFSKDFVYQVGKKVKVEDFCDNRWNAFAPGIHFFITRDEAVKYLHKNG